MLYVYVYIYIYIPDFTMGLCNSKFETRWAPPQKGPWSAVTDVYPAVSDVDWNHPLVMTNIAIENGHL